MRSVRLIFGIMQTAMLWVSLSPGMSLGAIAGFTETFSGAGSYASVDGRYQGLDVSGWVLSGNEGTTFDVTGEGLAFSASPMVSSEEFPAIQRIARTHNGSGGFRERIELRGLVLGNPSIQDENASASIVFGRDLGEASLSWGMLSSRETQGPILSMSVSGESSPVLLPVPLSARDVAIEVEFDDIAREVRFFFDHDVDDGDPPLLAATMSANGPVADIQRSVLYIGSSGSTDIEVSGIIHEWSMVPLSDAAGDYNGDGLLSISDVASLVDGIRSGDTRFDLTMDGFVDFTDLEVWVHDLKGTYFGDANLDGEFNSIDLVNLFQAGEYEDGIEGNSTWATGDWNADGEFRSADLVLAFQDGGYEQGPRESLASVPEPSGMLAAWIGAFTAAAAAHRRRYDR